MKNIILFYSTCLNAMWNCKEANTMDKQVYPNAEDTKTMCKAADNLEFTICESPEPTTCKVFNKNYIKSPILILVSNIYLEYAFSRANECVCLSSWLSVQSRICLRYETEKMCFTNRMSLSSWRS